MTHWALSTTIGRTTLTRYRDDANNSDKFRRFIAIANPLGPGKALITQTGRWTQQTARGDWSGGTYRFIKFDTFGWEKPCSLDDFLAKNVEKKMGDYFIANHLHGSVMSDGDVRMAVARAKDAPWHDAAAPAPSLPTPVQAVARTERPSTSNILELGPWLLQAAAEREWGQFDLLPEYANIKAKADRARAQLDQVFTDLDTALSLIMLKEA